MHTLVHQANEKRRYIHFHYTKQTQRKINKLVSDFPGPDPAAPAPAEWLYLLDATDIKLRLPNGSWGFRASHHVAAKLHTRLRFSPGSEVLPDAIVCTSAPVSDRDSDVLKHLVTAKKGTYIMDCGYVKYTRFAEWDTQGIFFVARLYANQTLQATDIRETRGEANILEDAKVNVPTSDQGTRQLRRVTYRYTGRKGEEKKAIVLTNRWDLQAHEVAELYRKRWRIETFFNDFKNRMNGAHLHTSNPQGVYN